MSRTPPSSLALAATLAASALPAALEAQVAPVAVPRDSTRRDSTRREPARRDTARLAGVRVVGVRRRPYVAPTAAAGSRLDVPLRDVPQSIQVVTRELLADRGTTQIGRALETVSGVAPAVDYGGNGAPFYYVRGFSTEANSLRDGFRSYGYLAPRDVQNVDRFELLKGPSSVLYGQSGTLGGTLNTVSKRPDLVERRELALVAGSFGQVRPTADLGGALGTRAAYRLNLAYDDAGSYRDFVHHRSVDVAPALLVGVGGGTLTLLGEYTHQRFRGFDFGFPTTPAALALPVRRYYGIPGRDGGTNQGTTGLAEWVRPLGRAVLDTGGRAADAADDTTRALSLREAVFAGGSRMTAFESFVGSSPAGSAPVNFLCPTSDERTRDYAWQNELRARFRAGGVAHRALVGTEVARTTDASAGACLDEGIPVDLAAPDYAPAYGAASPFNVKTRRADNVAVFIQDYVALAPRVTLNAGVRVDHVRTTVRDDATTGPTAGQLTDDQRDWHASPRVGLAYAASASTSLYGGYSTSFQSQLGHDAGNLAFKPEIGRQVEVGAKGQTADGRFTGTLAVYDLVRRNVLTTDPANPRNSVPTGAQRSRGVELDLAAAPVAGLALTGSYGFTDATVTADNDLPVGTRLLAAPRHTGSAWARYEWLSGALQGVGVGAGVVAASRREASQPNSFQLPAFVRTDASLSYRWRAGGHAWTAQANLLNAFDRRYFLGGGSGFGWTILPAAPRSLQGRLQVAL